MNPNLIQRSISLPTVVALTLPGQYVSVLMNALNDSGPVRVVMPVIQAIESQLRAQATADVPQPAGGLPPAKAVTAPTPVPVEAVAVEAAPDPAFQ